jgi:hypothetical protein
MHKKYPSKGQPHFSLDKASGVFSDLDAMMKYFLVLYYAFV